MTNATQYLKLINSFNGNRILVIGDLMVDVYLKGNSTRLCPEAPVPVVNIDQRTSLPGGAANTVCNLKALGATVTFCSVIGNDAEGDEAIRLLKEHNIDNHFIVRDAARRTITKSRVVSGTQVITRIDQGSEEAIGLASTNELVRHIERWHPYCDAIVISDYNKGVITQTLLEALVRLQQREQKFIGVDSKRLAFFSAVGPSYAKPNYDEVTALLGLSTQAKDRAEQIAQSADTLYKKIDIPIITVTLDQEGSVIIENGQVVQTVAAPPVSVPHVSGAGDSYLSGFVLAYLNSRNSNLSAQIATAAASIAIRKEGTATCSQAELKSYFNIHSKFISDFRDLRDICDSYRNSGKRLVFTNGCFDILHSGHVTYLHRARELGDVLIVGVNTDESIRRIKGTKRPINTLVDRLQVLAGLSAVDHIVPFGNTNDDTPVPVIRIVRPHIFAKGGDYTNKKLPEANTVEACGGSVIFLEHIPDHSTTRIINKITQALPVDAAVSDFRA